MDTTAINEFLLANGFTVKSNPCISPDFCLDVEGSCSAEAQAFRIYAKSSFEIGGDVQVILCERKSNGDYVWVFGHAAEAKDAADRPAKKMKASAPDGIEKAVQLPACRLGAVLVAQGWVGPADPTLQSS